MADSTTDFFYNWSNRIKSNLVLVLLSVLFIYTSVFFRMNNSLLESLVVSIPFTTITLGILRLEFSKKWDNVNQIVDQSQDLHYRTNTCNTGIAR